MDKTLFRDMAAIIVRQVETFKAPFSMPLWTHSSFLPRLCFGPKYTYLGGYLIHGSDDGYILCLWIY